MDRIEPLAACGLGDCFETGSFALSGPLDRGFLLKEFSVDDVFSLSGNFLNSVEATEDFLLEMSSSPDESREAGRGW